MADHVRFNPFLRLWLPDYLVNVFDKKARKIHTIQRASICFSHGVYIHSLPPNKCARSQVHTRYNFPTGNSLQPISRDMGSQD